MYDNKTTGEKLNKKWKVGALHALYREDGKWYHHLRQFPGALFDKYGFVIFKNENEYLTSEYLQHGQDLNIPSGISSIPGYKMFSEITELILIENWEDIIENFQNFNSAIETSSSIAKERLNIFFHWYYLPSLDIFAPSKFLGYKGMTLFTYKGKGSGSNTQQVLKNYFTKLDRNSPEYNILLTKLENFLKLLGKEISEKTKSGSGAIYIPKEEYEINLLIDQQLLNQITKDIDSINEENNESFKEGLKKERLVSIYERKPSLRAKAIQIHGVTCQVCGFNFGKTYGKHGENYIEVHHIKPLSTLITEKEINPKNDLAVLCSNCHRMAHRDKDNPLDIVDLQNLI